MLRDEDIVSVYNRHSNGTCGYTIPEMNGLHRNFASGEIKKIKMEELRKLDWVPGGHAMLLNYLVILNEDAVEELLGEVEPEYYYKKEDVENLLIHGSLDELEDCLNFAPKGVTEVVRDVAISINLNDMNKRKLIEEKTGFGVDNAIRANEAVAAALAEAGFKKEESKPKVRKAAPSPASKAPQRKASAPKYKVVEDK